MGKASTSKEKATKKPKAAKEDLNALALAVSAEDALNAPGLPVKVALLEAGRVLAAAKRARKNFLGLPTFDVAVIDGLAARIDFLERAEKAWNAARYAKSARKLTDVRKEGEKLRAEMMKAARFLTRKDADAQVELDHIDEGEGLADLVADLADLASFVEERKDTFAQLDGFDPDAGKTARALAAELTAGVDGDEATAAIDARNRAFVLLEEALDEIRAAAAFVFRQKPEKARAFASEYQAQKKRRQRKQVAPPAAPPAG